MALELNTQLNNINHGKLQKSVSISDPLYDIVDCKLRRLIIDKKQYTYDDLTAISS